MSPEDRAHLDRRLDDLDLRLSALDAAMRAHFVTVWRGPNHPNLGRLHTLVQKIANKIGVPDE